MTDALAKRLIDALVTDLNASASLPAHITVSYRRPRVILPEDCPLLVVWLLGKRPTPTTTEEFDSAIGVGVSWHLQVVEEVATLVDDSETAVALLDGLSKIEARIRALAPDSLTGVDECWEILPGESQYLPPELQGGFCEGYAIEAIARVTEV